MNSKSVEKVERIQYKDFRLFLQHEMVRRCEKNKSYSLRAFARDLGTHHATLSAILANRRPLTHKSIIKLCRALGLSDHQIKKFSDTTQRSKQPLKPHEELSLDTFVAISEWYHDAILEMTRIENFKPDFKIVARSLGISVNEVRASVERLSRLGLMEVSKNGWKDLSRNNTTNVSNDLTSTALRNLQKNILELSMGALLDLPRSKRDHTSLVLAMNSNDLPEVKERIKKFRFELVEFIERNEVDPDNVYQMAFSVFPLMKEF